MMKRIKYRTIVEARIKNITNINPTLFIRLRILKNGQVFAISYFKKSIRLYRLWTFKYNEATDEDRK
ncbi:hypothetical protein J14TS2_08910 [Bacillus sp. J14TS2]|nr:hypothetical protein J14TS2_08910 [Bacillus sp. J14TS2]